MKKTLFFILLLATFLTSASNFIQAQSTAVDYGVTSASDRDLVIYPNPVRDNATIKTMQAGVKLRTLVIYSIVGKEVAEYRNLNQSSINLNLVQLRPGKYLVKYTLSDRTEKVAQLIKQ